jgi:DNA-binding NarL/FixJ family response regulator
VRILVADDHAVVRAGLKAILSARAGWEICAGAETGDEAVAFAKKHRRDVAILDLNMPGITGPRSRSRNQEIAAGDCSGYLDVSLLWTVAAGHHQNGSIGIRA